MDSIWSAFQSAFSDQFDGKNLPIGAMAIRAVFVVLAWLVIIRFGDRRMLGKYSGFDTVIAVIIGALLGRTINGGAPLWGTLIAAAALVAVHWLLAFVSHRWHAFGKLVKGEPLELVSEGKVDRKAMRASFLTDNDLREMLRLHGRINEPSEAKLAVLERNGEISAIPLKG
jgi:uncharacterized membrane protein YcaP (DUF421 family)